MSSVEDIAHKGQMDMATNEDVLYFAVLGHSELLGVFFVTAFFIAASINRSAPKHFNQKLPMSLFATYAPKISSMQKQLLSDASTTSSPELAPVLN